MWRTSISRDAENIFRCKITYGLDKRKIEYIIKANDDYRLLVDINSETNKIDDSSELQARNVSTGEVIKFINNGKDENRAERAKFLEEVVTNNLNESSLDKQYKAILRSCEKLYNKNNVLVPIQSKDGVISIDKLFQDSLKELAQAENGFNGLIEPYSKNDTNKE